MCRNDKENFRYMGNTYTNTITYQTEEVYEVLLRCECMYDSNFEHCGIARKAYMSLIEFCLKSLNLKSLIAYVLLANESSVNFHTKFGYALLKKHEDIYGKYVFNKR